MHRNQQNIESTNADPELVLLTSSADGVAANAFTYGGFLNWYAPSLSDDIVVITSDADNLVTGDTNGTTDIFFKSLSTGAIVRVSTTSTGGQVNGYSAFKDVTSDGHGMLFTCDATNINSNANRGLYYKDLTTGQVREVDTLANGYPGEGTVVTARFMHDETKVIFSTTAGNLAPGDTNNNYDIFIKDLTTGAIQLVSSNSEGVIENKYSLAVSHFSADDTKIYLNSTSTNLVAYDTNHAGDIFMKDMTTGWMTRISTTSSGGEINGLSTLVNVTEDDNTMLFMSLGSNLAPNDTNGGNDIFLKNLTTGQVSVVSSNSAGEIGNGWSQVFAETQGDKDIIFTSTSSNLVDGDTNGSIDVFTKNILTGSTTRIFTAENSHDGDVYDYYPIYVNDDGMVALEVTHYNTANDAAAKINGGITVTTETIYIIDLANLNATVLTSGSSGYIYAPGNDLRGSYVNEFGLSVASPDTKHVVLHWSESLGGPPTAPLPIGNDYLVPITATSIQKNIGDSHADTLNATNGNNYMFGFAGKDNITAGTGNDVIDGGKDADIMRGGYGDDVYYVDNTGDIIREYSDHGVDTVNAYISWALDINLETLTLLGTGDIGATGNGADNILTGNAGKNILDGGSGADTMVGGAGDDVYIVENAQDIVTETDGGGSDLVNSSVTCTLGDFVENLTLTGRAAINGVGNALDNVIKGNAGNNTLVGGDGDDTLDGGAGGDTMRGGNGNDLYIVSNITDVVKEAADQGTDLVKASVSFSLVGQQIENLTLTGTKAINATGNSLANTLSGNNAANVLNGGFGADTLTGHGGADIFLFGTASGADTITDFSAAQGDSINVHAYTSGTAHTAYIVQAGGDVHINLGGSNVITVTGASVADVTAHMVW